MADITIKRALIAVYDKTGIADFAKALVEEFGIEIISTGGTARHLQDAGIPVTMVEAVTGFPEMLDGRVKTLHPKIHAGILADRDNPDHMRQLEEQGIQPIDMVVVNLYPFEKTIAKPDCTFEEAIEMIDIGGPCMLRAAAKNHTHVAVLSSSVHYWKALADLRKTGGRIGKEFREWVFTKAFQQTGSYEIAIHTHFATQYWETEFTPALFLNLGMFTPTTANELRYGENPGQRASIYVDGGALTRLWGSTSEQPAIDGRESEMSFNNYADADAAMALCRELARAASAFPILWHRFSTGGTQDNSHVDERVSTEQVTLRNLPHIQKSEATYFVTFRVRRGELAPAERSITLSACRYWHGRKMTLHATVVMPDHVHLLLTPHEAMPGQWVSLGEILHSVKRYSAREINKSRGVSGALWMDESFDRIVRNEREFKEKWEYIEANATTAGLPDARSYRWFWNSQTEFQETVDTAVSSDQHPRGVESRGARNHRLKTGATGAIRTVCFIKHTNACGVGMAGDPVEAYRRAYLGDPNAAMGGILAVDFPVDAAFAEVVMGSLQRWGKDAGAGAFFVEVLLAPSIEPQAVELIRTRKKWGERVRILTVGDMTRPRDASDLDYKKIAGGMLVQTCDLLGLNEGQWKVVTERSPGDAEMADLRLAWLVCKHTKSNAITLCKNGMLIGNGAGQMSRIMSCRIATWLAKENGHEAKLTGAAAASDAFFPFRDGPDILADAGVTAIIQPGGSKRDKETIAACNERNIAMIFTGTRHFKH